MRYTVGRRVRVAEGSGLLSGKIGTIVKPGPCDGRGVPMIAGHYKPIDRSECWIRLDTGDLATMFKRRLFPID